MKNISLVSVLLCFLFISCSTTKDGKMVFDPKPVDDAAKKATSKIKKRKDYCSPLDKSLGKCGADKED